jgi:hypothetical protein
MHDRDCACRHFCPSPEIDAPQHGGYRVRIFSEGQPNAGSPHLRPESPKRGLMSGETLRAPRQQLRLLRASDFCFSHPYPESFPKKLIKSKFLFIREFIR